MQYFHSSADWTSLTRIASSIMSCVVNPEGPLDVAVPCPPALWHAHDAVHHLLNVLHRRLRERSRERISARMRLTLLRVASSGFVSSAHGNIERARLRPTTMSQIRA
jgi:hypothetical protein